MKTPKVEKTVIASGPVIVEDGKILLNMHGETPIWKFCGGKVEDFTLNLIENARKKVMEEMGLEIEILDDEPYFYFVRRKIPTGDVVDIILIHFRAKRLNEIKPGPETDKWNWFDVNDLPPDTAPNIAPALKFFGYIK